MNVNYNSKKNNVCIFFRTTHSIQIRTALLWKQPQGSKLFNWWTQIDSHQVGEPADLTKMAEHCGKDGVHVIIW